MPGGPEMWVGRVDALASADPGIAIHHRDPWVRKEFWTVNSRLLAQLDRHDLRYEIVPHGATETAVQAARDAHVAANRVIKVVVFRDAEGRDLMAAVPATHVVDPRRVAKATGWRGLRLENEQTLERLFPDCEVGAMPPVGHLYGLPLVVDRCLTRCPDRVWFQPGNHHALMGMSITHFRRLAQPYFEGMCLGQEVSPGLVERGSRTARIA